MILAALVVVFDPRWLLLVRLDVVDQIPLTPASRIIVIRYPIVSLVHTEFDRRVDKLALELGLFRIKDHLFTVLIRLELLDLARVVGGGLREFHAHARSHQHFLVRFSSHKHFLSRQLTFAIHLMPKTASYRVCACAGSRMRLVARSLRDFKAI